MGHRLSRISTRTGDGGETGLGDGSRTSKASLRIAAIGDVDELNSTIGLLLAETLPDDVRASLGAVQHDLFDMGGELSIPGSAVLDDAAVKRLEEDIERFNAGLPPLREFILPGGSRTAALAHVARTVCRRAERSVVALAGEEPVGEPVRIYLNRLSDLLFIVARCEARAGGGEVLWNRNRPGPG
jgi:cob(I)alamin adenosyltransferase